MLLHYGVLSESDLSPSQAWEYYTYTDKDTHSPSARERIEVSETKATFRPSASCVWRFPNKWLSSCKPADKANTCPGFGMRGEKRRKTNERDRIMGSFYAWALYGVLSENGIYFIVLSITSVALIILAPLRWKWKNGLYQRAWVQLRGQA